MKVTIEDRPALRVVTLRHVGPYHEVGPTFHAIVDFAAKRGLMGPGVRLMGASWDDPKTVPASDLRYDACVVVPDGFEIGADASEQTLGGGRYLFAIHEGAYEGLEESYDALFATAREEHGGVHGEGPCLEVYLNDPSTAPPEELRTEIWMPLA